MVLLEHTLKTSPVLFIDFLVNYLSNGFNLTLFMSNKILQ